MKYMNKINLILFTLFFLCSCNDFLDEKPRKGDGITLETFEQLEALLSAKTEPLQRQGLFDGNAAQRFMTDCYELTTDICDAGYENLLDYTAFELNCFQPKYTEELLSDTQWLCGFKNIYLANTILFYLDKVTGGTPEQRATLAKRAYFIRAYNYYELANCYCVPYCEANLNELGLPINEDINYKEEYFRASLKEVYEFIESDLKQALDLSTPLIEGGVRKVWRENSALVNGFAARLYLTKGDYATAKMYAEKALDHESDLADYNNPAEIAADMAEDGNGDLHESNTWYTTTQYELEALYAATAQRSYYRRNNFTESWTIPSQKFLDSFNKDYDMRYKYFYYEDFVPLSIDGWGIFYEFTDIIPGYSYFSSNDYDSGPSVSEMILIKAESMARQGQWSEALNYLNTNFRPYRIAQDAPANVKNLSATNKDEAIAVILKERMFEFPFTLRWHDIRRCNFNDDSNDDITITRSFYEIDPGGVHAPLYDNVVEYKLGPNSNKYTYTMAIPAKEVTVSKGTIEQNRYE